MFSKPQSFDPPRVPGREPPFRRGSGVQRNASSEYVVISHRGEESKAELLSSVRKEAIKEDLHNARKEAPPMFFVFHTKDFVSFSKANTKEVPRGAVEWLYLEAIEHFLHKATLEEQKRSVNLTLYKLAKKAMSRGGKRGAHTAGKKSQHWADHWTLLQYACHVGRDLKLVRYLVETLQADVNAGSQDGNGYTALHLAVRSHTLAVVRYLIRYDPTVLCNVNSRGETPLHWATGFDVPQVIVGLLAWAYPMAILTRDADGNLPLDLADEDAIEDWLGPLFDEILQQGHSCSTMAHLLVPAEEEEEEEEEGKVNEILYKNEDAVADEHDDVAASMTSSLSFHDDFTNKKKNPTHRKTASAIMMLLLLGFVFLFLVRKQIRNAFI